MKKEKQEDIYKRMQRFADLTKIMIYNNQADRVKKCFVIAEKLLQTGNNELKNAVLNVYLFSISSYLELQGEDGRQILNYFPELLRQEYNHQIIASYHE